MAPAWWSLVAFVGGGCAGMLLMALMRMAGDLPEQLDNCPKGWIGNDGVRQKRKWREAATRYLMQEAIN